MAGSARIDELKKKFDENPGRYFAPLANEYRKAGEIEQAITICRTYLAEKPGHMSGLIVFGQALYEATQFDEARSTFEQALALDPENLIALRHLGDIARDIGDPESARGWYQRVLDADPRNEEIAAQLAAVKDAIAATPASGAPAPAAATESSGMSGWGDINPEQPAAADVASASTVVMEPVRTPDPAFAEPERPSLQLLAIDEPMPSADIEREAPAMDFEPTSFSPPDASSGGGLGIERTQEFAIPTAGGDLGGIELDRPFEAPLEMPRTSSADLGLEPREFAPPPPEESAIAAEMRVSLAFEAPASVLAEADAAGRASSAMSGLPAFDDASAAKSEPAKEPPAVTGASGFVTETMAELYLAQGYRSEAIGVYRQLIQQSPNDEGLREKLRKIEQGDVRSSGSQPKVVEPAASSVAAASGTGAAKSGRSARSFFGSLASRRAPQRASDPYQSTFESPAVTPPRDADVTGPSDWIMEPSRSAASTEAPEAAPATPPVTSDAFGSSDDAWPEPAPSGASGATDTGWGIAPVTSATPARGHPPQAEPEAPEHEAAEPEASEPVAREPEAAAPHVGSAPEESAPAMTGSLDSLFSGKAVPSSDDAAASMLAGAFAPHDSAAAAPAAASAEPAPRTSSPGMSSPSTTSSQRGNPARAAVGELSLDHVFKDSPRKSGAVRQTGGFSFDQFFSDTATAQPSDKSSGPDGEVNPTEGGTRNDDEVGQFTSWLEGLKKK